MAFVAIANFAQQNFELGYAFKFIRMLLLILEFGFGIWGFALGIIIFVVLIATNNTVLGRKGYLYPLIPFSARDMKKLLFRHKKSDFRDAEEKTDTGVKRDG
jgi:stage V sporulation protein AF